MGADNNMFKQNCLNPLFKQLAHCLNSLAHCLNRNISITKPEQIKILENKLKITEC